MEETLEDIVTVYLQDSRGSINSQRAATSLMAWVLGIKWLVSWKQILKPGEFVENSWIESEKQVRGAAGFGEQQWKSKSIRQPGLCCSKMISVHVSCAGGKYDTHLLSCTYYYKW